MTDFLTFRKQTIARLSELLTMRSLILFAIRAYQRCLSPYKGFSCAYRCHTGRASCSDFGYRAIRLLGVGAGLSILRERMFLCGVAHRRHAPPRVRPHWKQRGDCDVGCDGCDFPDLPSAESLSDCTNCCDSGNCDWSNGKRKSRKGKTQESDIHIPSKALENDAMR